MSSSLSAGRGGVARRRLFADAAARIGVTAGGLAVIASVLAIFVFLLWQAWPLLAPARVETSHVARAVALSSDALVVDPGRELADSLGHDGVLRAHRLADGEQVLERTVTPEDARALSIVASSGDDLVAGATLDGRVVLVPIAWRQRGEGAGRRTELEPGEASSVAADPSGRPLRALAARGGPDGATIVAVLDDQSVVALRRTSSRHFLTGAVTAREERRTLDVPAPVARLLLDRAQRHVFAGLVDGRLAIWDLDAAGTAPRDVIALDESTVTAMALLVGDRALVTGRADGRVDVWFHATPRGAGQAEAKLQRVHSFEALHAPVTAIATSSRNRTIAAADASGGIALLYSTSERVLWKGRAPSENVRSLVFSPRADALVVAGADGVLGTLAVDNPHPEASWRAYFGRVWYEGYAEPAFVWQSSSGSDDFEPKLSLVPLLVGTLKGTFYSIALALPLAVLAALYTSQFLHPRLQRIVKPTVELMASLPSVVLGFLAGLWLAPRLEQSFPGVVLALLGTPFLAIVAAGLWHAMPARWRARMLPGSELGMLLVVVAAGSVALLALGERLELQLLGGSFPQWLHDTTAIRYDQRNAIVVGLAMGFAVIPILFAIAEDAFSNVPQTLTAGSLALGASRWQTVVRVVLPTASPGIFSGAMVAFGRAVGETMIVLMATGNTPILGWSPFDGFRTLSANIAVEIPEAPVGSTLYRTLFVAALLLFALTFVLNTVAELVRQRLRARYARL